jgi:hypothetical protein
MFFSLEGELQGEFCVGDAQLRAKLANAKKMDGDTTIIMVGVTKQQAGSKTGAFGLLCRTQVEGVRTTSLTTSIIDNMPNGENLTGLRMSYEALTAAFKKVSEDHLLGVTVIAHSLGDDFHERMFIAPSPSEGLKGTLKAAKEAQLAFRQVSSRVEVVSYESESGDLLQAVSESARQSMAEKLPVYVCFPLHAPVDRRRKRVAGPVQRKAAEPSSVNLFANVDSRAADNRKKRSERLSILRNENLCKELEYDIIVTSTTGNCGVDAVKNANESEDEARAKLKEAYKAELDAKSDFAIMYGIGNAFSSIASGEHEYSSFGTIDEEFLFNAKLEIDYDAMKAWPSERLNRLFAPEVTRLATPGKYTDPIWLARMAEIVYGVPFCAFTTSATQLPKECHGYGTENAAWTPFIRAPVNTRILIHDTETAHIVGGSRKVEQQRQHQHHAGAPAEHFIGRTKEQMTPLEIEALELNKELAAASKLTASIPSKLLDPVASSLLDCINGVLAACNNDYQDPAYKEAVTRLMTTPTALLAIGETTTLTSQEHRQRAQLVDAVGSYEAVKKNNNAKAKRRRKRARGNNRRTEELEKARTNAATFARAGQMKKALACVEQADPDLSTKVLNVAELTDDIANRFPKADDEDITTKAALLSGMVNTPADLDARPLRPIAAPEAVATGRSVRTFLRKKKQKAGGLSGLSANLLARLLKSRQHGSLLLTALVNLTNLLLTGNVHPFLRSRSLMAFEKEKGAGNEKPRYLACHELLLSMAQDAAYKTFYSALQQRCPHAHSLGIVDGVQKIYEYARGHLATDGNVAVTIDFSNAFNYANQVPFFIFIEENYPGLLPFVATCYGTTMTAFSGNANLQMTLTTGCFQGDTISGAIFEANVADFLSKYPLPPNVDMASFYDDTTLFVKMEHMAETGPLLTQWLVTLREKGPEHGLDVNIPKCKVLCSSEDDSARLNIMDLPVLNPYADSIPFLGSNLSRRIEFINVPVRQQAAKMQARLRAIVNLLWKQNPQLAYHLIVLTVCPMMNFNMRVTHVNEDTTDILRQAQRGIDEGVRQVLRVPSDFAMPHPTKPLFALFPLPKDMGGLALTNFAWVHPAAQAAALMTSLPFLREKGVADAFIEVLSCSYNVFCNHASVAFPLSASALRVGSAQSSNNIPAASQQSLTSIVYKEKLDSMKGNWLPNTKVWVHQLANPCSRAYLNYYNPALTPPQWLTATQFRYRAICLPFARMDPTIVMKHADPPVIITDMNMTSLVTDSSVRLPLAQGRHRHVQKAVMAYCTRNGIAARENVILETQPQCAARLMQDPNVSASAVAAASSMDMVIEVAPGDYVAVDFTVRCPSGNTSLGSTVARAESDKRIKYGKPIERHRGMGLSVAVVTPLGFASKNFLSLIKSLAKLSSLPSHSQARNNGPDCEESDTPLPLMTDISVSLAKSVFFMLAAASLSTS